MASYGVAQTTVRRSWFGRNWKWVLAPVLGLVMLISAAVIIGFNNAEATKWALATATANPALIERIGQPMKAGWFIGGSIEVSQGFGRAELTIPISGPKGKGTVYALQSKRPESEKLSFLQFGANGEKSRLQLLSIIAP